MDKDRVPRTRAERRRMAVADPLWAERCWAKAESEWGHQATMVETLRHELTAALRENAVLRNSAGLPPAVVIKAAFQKHQHALLAQISTTYGHAGVGLGNQPTAHVCNQGVFMRQMMEELGFTEEEIGG